MRDFRALQGVGAALFLAVAYGLMSSHGSGADQRPARRSYARRSARTPGEYLSASAGPTMTRDAAGAYSPPPAFIAAPRLPSTARRGLGAVAPPPPPSAPGAPARGRAAGAASRLPASGLPDSSGGASAASGASYGGAPGMSAPPSGDAASRDSSPSGASAAAPRTGTPSSASAVSGDARFAGTSAPGAAAPAEAVAASGRGSSASASSGGSAQSGGGESSRGGGGGSGGGGSGGGGSGGGGSGGGGGGSGGGGSGGGGSGSGGGGGGSGGGGGGSGGGAPSAGPGHAVENAGSPGGQQAGPGGPGGPTGQTPSGMNPGGPQGNPLNPQGNPQGPEGNLPGAPPGANPNYNQLVVTAAQSTGGGATLGTGPACSCASSTNGVFNSVIDNLRQQGRLQLSEQAQGQLQGLGTHWNANGPGTAVLFHALQLGRSFTSVDQARPGDFMRVTERGGGHGHSVIFLGASGNSIQVWPTGTIRRDQIDSVVFSRLERPENLSNPLPTDNPHLNALQNGTLTVQQLQSAGVIGQ